MALCVFARSAMAAAETRPQVRAAKAEPREKSGRQRDRSLADGDDPDVPSPLRAMDKERFLRGREQYIMLRRGLPYPPGRPNPRSQAIHQMEAQELRLYGRRAQTEFLPRKQTLLNSTSWTSAGPVPIPNGQTNGVSLAVSGRVTSIAVHPTNANTVYVGTAGGGLYRSLDGGVTWTQLMDGALSLAIGSIAVDPVTTSTIIVGTGEDNGFFGVGVYRIKNADGVTPVLEGPFGKDSTGGDLFTGASITKVLMSPTDENIVFVSTITSGSSGRGFDGPLLPPSRGLYRSINFTSAAPVFTKLPITTANGGDRWVTDMVFEPGNPNNLIVNVGGAANVGSVPDGGLYRVTNALSATPTYTQTLNIGGFLNAKFAINNILGTITVLAATEESTCPNANGVLRRSTDGGQTWSAPLPSPDVSGFCGQQCWFDLAVAIDPTTANNILVGGEYDDNGATSCRSSTQLRSIDGGVTFARASTGLHADTHAIVFAPSNPTIVYAGNDGGIFKSTDSGSTWTSLNNSGFNATQFYSVSSHPLERSFAIGGTQDNGTEMMDFSGTWTRADFGDGGFALIDRNAGDLFPLLMVHTYYNQTNSIIGFSRVTKVADAHDNGWRFYGYSSWNNGIGNDPAVLFFAPMAYGPGNPSTLYFGTDRLYRSSNGGLAMSIVSQAPLATYPSTGNPPVAISTIAVSPQDDNVRIVGLVNGKVFATTTGANPMTDVTGSLPSKFVGRVLIDPNDKNVAYAAYCGFGLGAGQHVWKTTNLAGGATTWFVAGNGIPDIPVSAFVIDPRNSSNLYAGTDIGVYNSIDGGATWNPFATGLPRVPVFDLDIQSASRVLRAATHGRGIWEISLGSPYPALALAGASAVATNGNGNAFLEPGERGALTVQVRNHGIVAATNVTATVTTTTPGVTILNGASSFADIATATTGTNATPLTFNVAPTVSCGVPVDFVITMNAAGAPPVTQPWRIVLGGPAATVTFNYAGAASIPDNDINGVLVPLTVSGLTGPVSKLTVTIGGSSCTATFPSSTVGIEHQRDDDLQMYLVSPAGTTVPLAVNAGVLGVNFCNTVFDDASTADLASLPSSSNPFSGTFKPASPLSQLAGENGNGTWSLKVVDVYAGALGTVHAFSISITPSTCAAACPAIALSPSTLPAATAGSAYSQTITATGGVSPYTFTTSSTLPAGASLSSAGLLSGSITQTGTFPITIIATDNNSCVGTQNYSLTVNAAPLGIPANVIATATSATSVNVTWTAATGADHYDVFRSSNNGSFGPVNSPIANAFTDSPVTPGITYLYKVRAVSSTATTSVFSNVDAATTIVFTDDPLTTGTTIIKAIHLTELRRAVNAIRASVGLTSVSFTDDLSTPTLIKAVHIAELRTALTAAMTILGVTPVYTDDPLTTSTVVKATHFQEIRNAVK